MVAGGRRGRARWETCRAACLPLPGTGRVPREVRLNSPIRRTCLNLDRLGRLLILHRNTLLAAILVVSVVVVTGYAGQVSLGQWAIAGFGAFVAVRLAAAAGLSFWIAAPLGIFSPPWPQGCLLRSRTSYSGKKTAVATLGMALVVESWSLGNSNWTGGVDGTTVSLPSFFGVSLNSTLIPPDIRPSFSSALP